MKGVFELDKNYKQESFVDFNKKRFAIPFTLGSILIAFAIFFKFRIVSCPAFTLGSLIFFGVGIFAFIIIHELIHGFFIWLFSKKRAHYNFSLLYASAGASDRYFDKSSYIVIALAPVIIISTFLLILINYLPTSLYNGALLVFALNVSGAIGDFYISILIASKDESVLVRDEGESMYFYTKIEE